MKNKIMPLGNIRTFISSILLLLVLSSLLFATIITKGTPFYIVTSVFCGITITVIGLSLQEWMVHRY